MYSRSSFQREPYHIPENYRGNAFHGDSTTPELPITPPPATSEPPDTAATAPSSELTTAPSEAASPPAPEAQAVSTTPKKATPSLLSSLLPPKPKGLGGGILGDLGAEDLLLLGVLLLLSQNESDDDILLLLLLLLFYK